MSRTQEGGFGYAAAAIVTILILGVAVACGSNTPASSQPERNTDPKQGWVPAWTDDEKYLNDYENSVRTDRTLMRCLGTTLVLKREPSYGGMTSIPDSPKCVDR